MTATARYPGFYRGVINLWVEDTLTRDYLGEVWLADPAVVFYVGGGSDGVRAVLREAEVAGIKNVFAFVDRDFNVSNRSDWEKPTTRRFVSSRHEIENHLLAPEVIAGCSLNTGRRAAADIRTRMHERAKELAWWMACRCLIAQVKREMLQDFPAHPTCPPVVDQSTAEIFARGLPWWTHIAKYSATLTEQSLRTALAEHHATVMSWLENGPWTVEFPGKELFRAVSGWVYTKPPRGTSSALNRSNLVKSVGKWQAENGYVPEELTDLLAVLKARVGVL